MMGRLRKIYGRCGWRLPFTVLAIALVRLAFVRHMLFGTWLRLTTQGRKGSNLTFGPQITVSPGGWLDLGDGIMIGARCAFEIGLEPRAVVQIGDDCWISHDCHLASRNRVQIGAHVLIGEFVSIRDSTHGHADTQAPIKSQRDVLGSIAIEDDVWIGRGCLIQGKPEGVVIGRGAIIAANSVVTRSIPSLEVWGGIPARFIKAR